MGFHLSSFEITLFLLVALSTTINFANGQGRLMKPAARATLWRDPTFEDRELPMKFDDDNLNCGAKTQIDDPGSECGVCGDPLSDEEPRDNEINGRYFKGVIAGEYKEGEYMPVEVEITAERRGIMQWRLCTDPKREVQECFNENLLKVINSTDNTTKSMDGVLVNGNRMYGATLQLPNKVNCEHCVVQWNFRTPLKICETDRPVPGRNFVDCKRQEVFRGCSDIRIEPAPKKKCCRKKDPDVVGFSKPNGKHLLSFPEGQYVPARRACQKQLGYRGGHLATIEDEEEFLELEELFFFNNDFGKKYWLDAAWDETMGVWRWLHSNQPLEKWTEKYWADGQPASLSNDTKLQVIWTGPAKGLQFTTGMASDSARFICEYGPMTRCGGTGRPKKPTGGKGPEEGYPTHNVGLSWDYEYVEPEATTTTTTPHPMARAVAKKPEIGGKQQPTRNRYGR